MKVKLRNLKKVNDALHSIPDYHVVLRHLVLIARNKIVSNYFVCPSKTKSIILLKIFNFSDFKHCQRTLNKESKLHKKSF